MWVPQQLGWLRGGQTLELLYTRMAGRGETAHTLSGEMLRGTAAAFVSEENSLKVNKEPEMQVVLRAISV